MITLRTTEYRSSWLLAAILILVISIGTSGCAIKLAPSYDKAILNGLGEVNEQTMTLMASANNGTRKTDFSSRKPTYDKLIGKSEALKVQSNARPVPRSYFQQIFGFGEDEEERLGAPTGDILTTISETLTKMRDTDEKQGLTKFEAAAFKNSFAISMDQAITYEKALER